jgi:hypothetical protein
VRIEAWELWFGWLSEMAGVQTRIVEINTATNMEKERSKLRAFNNRFPF